MVPPSAGMTWTSFSKVPLTVRSSTDGSRMTTISYLRMFWYPPPVVSAATVSPWQEGSCHPLGTSATHVTDRPSLPVGWALGQDGKGRARGITAAVPLAFAQALASAPALPSSTATGDDARVIGEQRRGRGGTDTLRP